SAGVLIYFGVAVFPARHRDSGERLRDLTPHPRNLSNFLLVAYAVWGLAPFAPLGLTSNSPLFSHLAAPVSSLNDLREFVIDESSGFFVLVYAKAFAILGTILYLVAMDAALTRLETSTGYQRHDTFRVQVDVLGIVTKVVNAPDAFQLRPGGN